MSNLPTNYNNNKRHNRHTSEGGSFTTYHSDAAAKAAAVVATNKEMSTITATNSNSIAMVSPHPNRLIPQPSNSPSPTKTAISNSSQSYQTTSQSSSRAPSPTASISSTKSSDNNYLNNIHLTRISSPSHLASLPPEFLTNDTQRPLLHIDISPDGKENEYHYYLNPMKSCVIFILLVEMLERFSFYGINYTTTAYLTGEYNDDWNADLPSITASSYVSISTAVAYTTPFLGALLADNLLGEYMTILLGSLLCYIPGLLLIAFTTIPYFLASSSFNLRIIQLGLLVLWPIGTGTVKACVNVFGAKQFHPILQSSLIESYYVNFYMCINIGALTGGIVVPIVAQWNVTVAYFIPVCMLGMGVMLFSVGTSRYVRPRPKHDVSWVCHEMSRVVCGGGNNNRRPKRDRGVMIQPSPSESKVGIGTILLLSSLIVPFNVAYAQMATTFIVQGSVMENFGVVDAPLMNNADAISVLAFGYVIGNVIYPALNARGIKLPTTYKFALGSSFGALAVACAIATEYQIHKVYDESGETITVLWQVFPYFLIGIGEIFAVSAAYELAFTVAPAKMKSVASAANLFMVGGLPNVFCIMLYNACRHWFLNSGGEAHIHKLEDYATAKVVNYFWLLEGIALFGVMINILPPISKWVAGIEEAAAAAVKSPMSTPNIRKNIIQRRKFRKQQMSSGTDEENTPLVRAQKHTSYLKYGNGPELIKSGSMRAGPRTRKS